MHRFVSVEICKLESHALPCMQYKNNESTASADASVEVPKLHNIKLLAFIHAQRHRIFLMHIFACMLELKEWVIIDHDCC